MTDIDYVQWQRQWLRIQCNILQFVNVENMDQTVASPATALMEPVVTFPRDSACVVLAGLAQLVTSRAHEVGTVRTVRPSVCVTVTLHVMLWRESVAVHRDTWEISVEKVGGVQFKDMVISFNKSIWTLDYDAISSNH